MRKAEILSIYSFMKKIPDEARFYRPVKGYQKLIVNHSMGEYVKEFTFRLNQGNCQIDTVDRMRSFIVGSVNKYISYRELIAS